MYGWGDNDHGQQGNNSTTVNRKPQYVMGMDGHKLTRVACGSSHSIGWSESDLPTPSAHEPVLFSVARDPLGASCLSPEPQENTGVATDGPSNEPMAKRHRPSLAKIVLSLNSNYERQQALGHILTALQIIYARDAVVGALMDSHAFLVSNSKVDEPADEAVSLGSVPEVYIDDVTISGVSGALPTRKLPTEGLDEFRRGLDQDDARLLVELLKLAVADRAGGSGREVLSNVLRALAQGRAQVTEDSLLYNPYLCQRTNERTNDRTNERKNERTNDRANERTIER